MSMSEEKKEKCWDFWKCPDDVKENCKIFQVDEGDDCWNLKDFRGADCPCVVKNGKLGCFVCPLFKKSNSDEK
jgi:hypothetical protein